MAEFTQVIKNLKRMCEYVGKCGKCPMKMLGDVEGSIYRCKDTVMENPEEIERIVTEWAKEHPAKTNADRFVEVFGHELTDDYKEGCTGLKCPGGRCEDCELDGFWDNEYKEVKR